MDIYLTIQLFRTIVYLAKKCATGPIADNFQMLKSVNGPLDLSICEALFIKAENPILNKQLKNSGSSIILSIF